MGKMTVGGKTEASSVTGLADRGLEIGQLPGGKGVKKGLEQDHGFAQAGIQVVVHGIQHIPLAIRVRGIAASEFRNGGLEAGMEIFDEIRERGDLIGELRLARKQNPAKQVVKQSDALTLGMLKILRIQRRDVRCDPEMFRMVRHHLQQRVKRLRQALTEGWRDGEHLVSLGTSSCTTESQGFVQIDAKHGIGCFQPTNATEISMRLIAVEGQAPILGH
jgi:hypothetical protein